MLARPMSRSVRMAVFLLPAESLATFWSGMSAEVNPAPCRYRVMNGRSVVWPTPLTARCWCLEAWMEPSFSGTCTSHSPLGPPVKAHRSPVWSLACSPDGRTAVSGGDAELVFWDIATRKPSGPPITSQKDRIWALAFSPRRRIPGVGGKRPRRGDLETGRQTEPVRSIGTPDTSFELTPAGVSFNPDGTLMATSTPE